MSQKPDLEGDALNGWLHGKPQQEWESDEDFRLRRNTETAMENMLEWLEKHREDMIHDRPATEPMLRRMTREYAIYHRKEFIELMSFWFDTDPRLNKKYRSN